MNKTYLCAKFEIYKTVLNSTYSIMVFSLIIPVYNRPDEVDELLESLTKSDYNEAFEIVLVEDGSLIPWKSVVMK